MLGLPLSLCRLLTLPPILSGGNLFSRLSFYAEHSFSSRRGGSFSSTIPCLINFICSSISSIYLSFRFTRRNISGPFPLSDLEKFDGFGKFFSSYHSIFYHSIFYHSIFQHFISYHFMFCHFMFYHSMQISLPSFSPNIVQNNDSICKISFYECCSLYFVTRNAQNYSDGCGIKKNLWSDVPLPAKNFSS